jgi:hypothetical protein
MLTSLRFGNVQDERAGSKKNKIPLQARWNRKSITIGTQYTIYFGQLGKIK